MPNGATYFWEKAVHCRYLASMAWNRRIKAELVKLADDFETEAKRSEAANGFAKLHGLEVDEDGRQ
jgi:hypothetical protein